MFALSFNRQALAVLVALSAGSVHALPAHIFFGEELNPGFSVAGNPVTARNAFLAALSGAPSFYGFENIAVGSGAPVNVAFGAINAQITGNGTVQSDTTFGRFNTTDPTAAVPVPQNFWEVRSGNVGQFAINFDSPISAFGFFGTDIGDFDGTLKVLLTPEIGVDEELIVRASPPSAPDGSLLFFGFADAAARYTKITFVSTGTINPTTGQLRVDNFGFDDFVVAGSASVIVPPNGNIPEPGSLALVALGLLGAAAVRKLPR